MSPVRRIVAEPRETFLARAAERRAQVLALRAEGFKRAEIADQLNMPAGTVRRIAAEAKKASYEQEARPVRADRARARRKNR
jgi:DNA-directed RNA polymerase specialized sigma24 family protein